MLWQLPLLWQMWTIQAAYELFSQTFTQPTIRVLVRVQKMLWHAAETTMLCQRLLFPVFFVFFFSSFQRMSNKNVMFLQIHCCLHFYCVLQGVCTYIPPSGKQMTKQQYNKLKNIKKKKRQKKWCCFQVNYKEYKRNINKILQNGGTF